MGVRVDGYESNGVGAWQEFDLIPITHPITPSPTPPLPHSPTPPLPHSLHPIYPHTSPLPLLIHGQHGLPHALPRFHPGMGSGGLVQGPGAIYVDVQLTAVKEAATPRQDFRLVTSIDV
jgi:hypothetical protein